MSELTPEQKANDLVDTFRVLLMSEDTDCGNEVLCSLIAIQHALIVAEEVIGQWEYIDTYLADLGGQLNPNLRYWQQVKEALKRL